MKSVVVNQNRKGWVDALRGLAIVLVVFGHQIPWCTEYFIFTSPFKMPLFFAISGYVFSTSTRVSDFVKKTLRCYIVPWFVLGIVPIIPAILNRGLVFGLQHVLQMLSGSVLWYMPCFVVAQTLQFVIRMFAKNIWGFITVSFASAAIGLFLFSNDILNYAMVNRALVVQVFYAIGFVFHKYEYIYTKIKWRWILCMWILYILLCWLSMVVFPQQCIDVHQNRYYNIPYCLLLIIFSTLLLFCTAQKSNIKSWLTSFIGQNSLVIYIWHGYAISIFVWVMRFFDITIGLWWLDACIKTLWAIMICGIGAIFLNRYLPWSVGKRK